MTMTSSSQDRLAVIYAAYQTAFRQRENDIAQAGSDAEANAVRRNIAALEAAYLKAEREGLEANGPEVEAAYQAASAAADAVTRAYQEGKALADRIRAVAGAVTAVSNLMDKAAGS